MPQGVENNFMPSIFNAGIESQVFNKIGKAMGERAAFFSSLGWCKNQLRMPLTRNALFKDSFDFGIDEDFSPRLSIGFLTDSDDAVCHIDIDPFQSKDFPQSHPSIQRKDDGCMQIGMTASWAASRSLSASA